MKKWLPFKSLKGQYEMIERMKKEQEREEKPELTEDEAEVLNRTMASLIRGCKTKVTYYSDFKTTSRDGIFQRISVEERRIYFYGFSLSFGDLIRIQRE